MTDLNAALVKHFLDGSGAEGKAMVEPNRMLNDGHRETVAVGFRVGHGGSATRLKQHNPTDTQQGHVNFNFDVAPVDPQEP
ncbi:hypothetical protein MF271_22385 (plasmid) [Deinococcus sp. KNUC1210]|uniref:hypothetical protein n=1 Tax=Deinococcus sp. KNUC1210 TaxID=2917691 RepID=UPI001EF058BA|nr:hypothetical protein [Deinococcus sp. KNUC1210]ULH18374.1 hypothetical protein MF271_22385 [Deinococcus sp. KNUC1210]